MPAPDVTVQDAPDVVDLIDVIDDMSSYPYAGDLRLDSKEYHLAYQEMFAEAAKILFGYFGDAAHNSRALHAGRNDFKESVSTDLTHVLCSHKLQKMGVQFVGSLDGDKIFASQPAASVGEMINARAGVDVRFILLGTISGDKEFSPTFVRQMFEMQTFMFIANATISIMREGKNHSQDWKSILGATCDEIMYKATLLEGLFTHASNLAQHEHIRSFMLAMMGISQSVPFSQSDFDKAAAFNEECRLFYEKSAPKSGEHLMKNAFDARTLSDRIHKNPIAFSTLVVWFLCGYSQDDSVVNDVWIPSLWGKPLMETIIDAQAQALKK